MTQTTAYTTLEASVYASKGLADCKVLVVDDEQSSCLLITTILNDIVQCEFLHDPARVIAYCEKQPPDLIVLDINMPGLNGIELCQQLKQNRNTSACPVVFITGDGNAETQNRCWQAGASDYVRKPVVASTLVHRVKNLLQSKLRLDLLTELTFKDQLTALYNRYYLFTEIPTQLKRLSRDSKSLGVIMIDIDFFKGFNDRYGHVAGDKCLFDVAQTLKEQLPGPHDSIVRFGGEEFSIFLPDTTQQACREIGQKMVDAISNLSIDNEASPLGKVTISAGYVVSPTNNTPGLEQLLSEADLYLYEAKLAGKARLQGSTEQHNKAC
ncbi:MAG: diguanylate cyclase [Gammaproteobacteria bacterium]|nr:diguanylate cyclase [Gammaproteobacteria bacterium]